MKLIRRIPACAALMLLMLGCKAQQEKSIWMDDLDIRTFSEGIPSISAKTNAGGDSLKINGIYFKRGIGTQSLSVLSFSLDGNAKQFTAQVGADDAGNPKSLMKFYVIGDKKILFESKKMKVGDAAIKLDVDLTGVKRLGLLVTVDSAFNRKAYSDWADAQFVMLNNEIPKTISNTEEKYILTPSPSEKPGINTASIFGARPGNPFLFTVAATGRRPMHFSAENLPAGLTINATTGIISGAVNTNGLYKVTLIAKNRLGTAKKELRIKISDTIALTPPMGWNGWNSWAREIDKEKVVSSANAMVSSGLANHGWTYINIDDAWQGQRGGQFNAIQPNEKFPDFKGMIDYIHSIGLKVGVYSTPWISSYAGFTGGSSDFESGVYPDSIRDNKRKYRYIGKYRFEKEDALQMAAWGVDYLKYDWHIDLNSDERMYIALKQSGRDIVYSLSNSAPFEYARDWERISNLWRTGGDIRDSWLSLYVSAFTIDKWAPFAGPGHWNDPDMMIVGNITTGSNLHPTRLTPDEQYSHVSIYSLLAAPLIIGCPLEQLDSFTINLLSNDEVIAIDQDPLGKAGRLLIDDNEVQIWMKPLEDGSYAIGLFNIDGFGKTPQSYFHWGDEQSKSFQFDLTRIGLKGNWKLRDIWRQKDLGEFTGIFKTTIPHHGVVLLRAFPVK
ncbi:MAG TPA: NPCBM/NEW2 domain-containing protein [Chitinophagaceae bacterium]|nr:NPCBM/NEW2 domain-containing protein [Chitinophagaceae bacterium]